MYKLTKQDEADVKRVVANYAQMEGELQGISDILKIKEELLKYQPFILSLLAGYQIDIPDPEEFESILKLYLFIWMYYRDNVDVRKKTITEKMYLQAEDEIVEMLLKSEKSSEQEKEKLATSYIQNIHSKALVTFIMFSFIEDPDLRELDRQAEGAILLGFKTIIRCFDKIAFKKPPAK